MKKFIISALLCTGLFIGNTSALTIDELPGCQTGNTLIGGYMIGNTTINGGHTHFYTSYTNYCRQGLNDPHNWCADITAHPEIMMAEVVASNAFINNALHLDDNLAYRACGEAYINAGAAINHGIHFVHRINDGHGGTHNFGWVAFKIDSDDERSWTIWSD